MEAKQKKIYEISSLMGGSGAGSYGCGGYGGGGGVVVDGVEVLRCEEERR